MIRMQETSRKENTRKMVCEEQKQNKTGTTKVN
jgi:hypothetical protein